MCGIQFFTAPRSSAQSNYLKMQSEGARNTGLNKAETSATTIRSYFARDSRCAEGLLLSVEDSSI